MDENMEEDASYQQLVMDDHNHNNWEADAYQHHHNHQHHNGHRHTELILPEPGGMSQAQQDPKELHHHHHHLSVNGEERGPGAHREPEPMTNKVTLNINSSASKFLMNVITAEDYQRTYWPKLDSAIDQLLTQSPGDCIPISYEQIYSCVYKCVCQQHSEQMYCDLITKITSHLRRISEELQVSCPDAYIERFNAALSQYMGALQSIVPLFIYMNKFYIETKLNRDLRDDLIKLFTEQVAEKHVPTLMPLLIEAQSTPFKITPSTMANIVKGLYTLRPDWAQLAPSLFSKFIPNILPPALESKLSEYAAEDQKLQRELIQNGFARGDQSRKRAGEELIFNGSSSLSSSCANARGFR
ncbi:CDK2-associated and cullin domain-containing protein 1 [Mobula birostris]|uniref:CDK2-associated and cullin domain-containing protein 1 n=1 Tax=Mobula birostris TaxID=1983395 RepID=UPI003B27C2FE